MTQETVCPECKGKGITEDDNWRMTEYIPCPACKGTSTVKTEETGNVAKPLLFDVDENVINISRSDLMIIKEAMVKNIQKWGYKDEVSLYNAIKIIEKVM